MSPLQRPASFLFKVNAADPEGMGEEGEGGGLREEPKTVVGGRKVGGSPESRRAVARSRSLPRKRYAVAARDVPGPGRRRARASLLLLKPPLFASQPQLLICVVTAFPEPEGFRTVGLGSGRLYPHPHFPLERLE